MLSKSDHHLPSAATAPSSRSSSRGADESSLYPRRSGYVRPMPDTSVIVAPLVQPNYSSRLVRPSYNMTRSASSSASSTSRRLLPPAYAPQPSSYYPACSYSATKSDHTAVASSSSIAAAPAPAAPPAATAVAANVDSSSDNEYRSTLTNGNNEVSASAVSTIKLNCSDNLTVQADYLLNEVCYFDLLFCFFSFLSKRGVSTFQQGREKLFISKISKY